MNHVRIHIRRTMVRRQTAMSGIAGRQMDGATDNRVTACDHEQTAGHANAT